MERVGEHPVPVGPLAVRWLGYELPELRAGATGTARVRLQNVGLAPWRKIRLAYHWLDDRGNPIVWDGWRTDFDEPVEPGTTVERDVPFRAPMPPGAYRFAFDLVDERRGWLSEFGNAMCETFAAVTPRIRERHLEVRVLPGPGSAGSTARALARQDEQVVAEGGEGEAVAHLVAGCEPLADWASRLLDAHAEGYAAVGAGVESSDRTLAAWRPSGGRNPSFPHPLLFPSLLDPLQPSSELGRPAYAPPRGVAADLTEPWIFEGRTAVRFRP
jgi:hypothetical protein